MTPLSGQTDQLARLMGVAELRHRVISQNLANVNTPGYHRRDVSFSDRLTSTSVAGALGEPAVIEEAGLRERADGNNVDVDREMGALQKNALQYQTFSQLLTSQMQLMRRAIES